MSSRRGHIPLVGSIFRTLKLNWGQIEKPGSTNMTSVKPAPDPAYPPGQGPTAPGQGPTAPPPGQGYGNQPPPPPPPYGYNAPQPGMVQTQPGAMVIVQGGGFREVPVTMICPYCQANISTSISYHVGALVIIIAVFLFFLGAWICAFIPCCIDGCKDVHHNCPNCHAQVGRYSRM